MNEPDDRELDALMERELRDHLARTLDAHAGRATGAFLAHAAAASRAGAVAHPAGPYRLWWWALAAGGLAACLAVAWLMQALTAPTPLAPKPGPLVQHVPQAPQHAQAEFQEVLRSVSWRTVDQDTVVLDDVPLHRVRRQVIETEQWYDATHRTHIEVTTPRQEVIFVGMRQQ